MKTLLLIVVGIVILRLLAGYRFEVVCTTVGVLLVWLPFYLAGLIGQRLGACIDREIGRRRRQDELVRMLLHVAQRERGT